MGCRAARDKRTLVRIVRTPCNEILLDPTGKASGRGTYVCPTSECLREALKRKRIAKALRMEIPEELVRKLEQIVDQAPSEM